MHKTAKEIMDRVKSKINSCGVDGITEQALIEMKYWTCIADAMTSYDYHYKIVEEMEKPENVYGENYDENGRFYTQPRNSHGRYMRRGYEPEMMMYRDMDYGDKKMYYTDSNHMGMNQQNMSNRGYSHSRYDMAKRGYEEAKEMNPDMDNTKMIEKIMAVVEEDMKELKPDMTATEKSMVRNKFTNMANMMM